MLQFPLDVKFQDREYKVDIWSGQNLGKEVACDTETDLAPFHTRLHKLVVFQAYGGGNTIYLVRRKDVRQFLNVHFESRTIWHNAPFDMQVLLTFGIPKRNIFEMYDNGTVFDTVNLWQLYNLAVEGKTVSREHASLKNVCLRLLGINISKDNNVRTSFDQYMDKEYEEMSYEHAAYASLDVVHTFNAYCKLLALIEPHDKYGTLLTHDIQTKGGFGLDQIYKNGIEVDQEKKEEIKTDLEKQISIVAERLAMWGYVQGKKGNTAAFDRAVTRLGIHTNLPVTKNGNYSSSKENIEEFDYEPFIKDYLDISELSKLHSFVANLEDTRIYPTYTNIKNTGRTSCQKGHNGLNIQQLPREGGIRQLFKAKDGHILIDVDYDGIELSGLAEVTTNLVGHSRMAEILNEGKDLHVATAASIFDKDPGPCLKTDMGEVTKGERQISKIANFGLGANMAADTFVGNFKKQGVTMTLAQTTEVKEKWESVAYPEMLTYYRLPFENKDGVNTATGKATYEHYTLTGRKRAKCSYTAWLNTSFQGLCADGLKLAIYNLTKAGYTLVAEVHDNIVAEVKIEDAEKALKDVCTIMVQSMKQVIPTVRVGVEGAATYNLGKDTEPVLKLNLNSQEL